MEANIPLYNLDKLKEIDDDPAFHKQVIEIFLQTVPENVSELKSACDKMDWDNVYFFAHKIKANINMLNIDCLKDEIVTIERNAKAKTNIEDIPSMILHVEDIINQSAQQMKALF